MFQRCIMIGLYYFSLKQINNGKCISAVRVSLRVTCINHPLPELVHIFFIYNDFHLSLNQPYVMSSICLKKQHRTDEKKNPDDLKCSSGYDIESQDWSCLTRLWSI